MALDHYVSQVHLRNFYSNDARGRLVGLKKDDLKKFYPWSENVCRHEEGSTNAYLTEPRAIEEFLKGIEPNYNEALARVRARDLNAKTVYVIAGFVGYVATSSPSAMRQHEPQLAASVEAGMKILEAQGLIPPAPEALGGKGISELLEDGSIKVRIDGKYPQAIGISQIEGRVHIFGNALWDVLIADPADGAFFTSDFPIAFGPSYHPNVISKTVPLAPDIAICIHPQLGERGKDHDFTFPNFRAKFRRLNNDQIVELNRRLVRSAEDMVFYNRDTEWLVKFVGRNRNYRADTVVTKIPTPEGEMIVSRQAIVPHERPSLKA